MELEKYQKIVGNNKLNKITLLRAQIKSNPNRTKTTINRSLAQSQFNPYPGEIDLCSFNMELGYVVFFLRHRNCTRG